MLRATATDRLTQLAALLVDDRHHRSQRRLELESGASPLFSSPSLWDRVLVMLRQKQVLTMRS